MTHKGFDVFPFHPNRTGPAAEQFQRRVEVLDPVTGDIAVDQQSAAPAPAIPVIVTCFGWEEVAALRDFLDARKGRAVPFWLPSYHEDLALAAECTAGSASALISRVGYAEMFAPTRSRRHLVLWEPHLPFEAYQVTTAVDLGLTESLTLAPVASRTYPAATTLISFLKFCRLDSDLTQIRWPSARVAEATLTVREIPTEVPV